MKVSGLLKGQFPGYLAFVRVSYPTRKDVLQQFQFQFLANPLLEDPSRPNILVATHENEQLVGQIGLNPCEYFLQGKRSTCYYCSEYFVAEEFRTTGAGLFLAHKALRNFRPMIAADVSASARSVFQGLGMNLIGSFHKFLWVRHPPAVVRSVFHKFCQSGVLQRRRRDTAEIPIPDRVVCDDAVFVKAGEAVDWVTNDPAGCLLTPGRSKAFVRWRYFEAPWPYYVYELDLGDWPLYLVARQMEWRGLHLVALVDYRVPWENRRKVTLILKAAKALAKAVGADGVFTMSSHQFFDRAMARSFFARVGKPSAIFASSEIRLPDQRVRERTALCATMADWDIDCNYMQN